MSGGNRIKLRSTTRSTPCSTTILPAKFTQKALHTMNFVNFTGKRACFRRLGAPHSSGFRSIAWRRLSGRMSIHTSLM